MLLPARNLHLVAVRRYAVRKGRGAGKSFSTFFSRPTKLFSMERHNEGDKLITDLDKGKLFERRGRKAKGLNRRGRQDSLVADASPDALEEFAFLRLARR